MNTRTHFSLNKIKTKEFFVKILFVFILMIVFVLFPTKDTFQQNTAVLFFFIIIPVLFNQFILKRKLMDFGLRIGKWRQGLLWGCVSAIFIALIFFIISYFFNFLEKYSIPPLIAQDYKKFVLYMLVDVLFLVLIYEFFFRGFIVFTFEKEMRHWSVIFQALVFYSLIVYAIYAGAGSFWDFMPYIILAPFSGIIAYKSRSIIYSIVLQFIVFTIINASVIRLVE